MNGLAFSKRVQRYKNIAYGKDARHTLDLYSPDQIDTTKPVIVFVYGGAWDSGHKDSYQFAGVEFAKLGYVTAVPNYRLYPDAKFPHFIEDVASACAVLANEMVNHGIHPTLDLSEPLDVVFIGHSAGAHTIAMLSTNPDYLRNAKARLNIKACIGLAGPYDLPLDDPLVVGKFDGVELHDISEQSVDAGHQHNHHDANPINFATAETPNMLLLHGRADVTVGLYHLERFSKRLEALNVLHETIVYDKVPHRHMVGGIASMFHFMNPVFKDISRYLEELPR